MSQWADLNCRPLPYQGNALPLSYIGLIKKRARDRVRTGDIQLGRLTLYQLSYSRIGAIKACGESRIRTCEGKNQQIYSLSSLAAWVSPLKFEPMEGLEPTTCWLQISCSSQLSYIGNFSDRKCIYLFFSIKKWKYNKSINSLQNCKEIF